MDALQPTGHMSVALRLHWTYPPLAAHAAAPTLLSEVVMWRQSQTRGVEGTREIVREENLPLHMSEHSHPQFGSRDWKVPTAAPAGDRRQETGDTPALLLHGRTGQRAPSDGPCSAVQT